jgi:metal-sulfur cluster biosynthetic enzyme
MKLFGRKPAPTPAPAPITEESARAALTKVLDPEIGINIVDLGLIYGLAVSPERIAVTMTLTSPTCPMGDLLLDEVEAALKCLAPSAEIDLEVVWEPPWSAEKMSPEAREQFGWEGSEG